MWDRQNEAQLGVLPGHEKTINCVCSHPYAPMTFASGSDDSTIRMQVKIRMMKNTVAYCGIVGLQPGASNQKKNSKTSKSTKSNRICGKRKTPKEEE